MEYYSALRRKEILTHAITWVKFRDILLSEISQSKRRMLYESSYEIPRVVKFIETESRMVVAGD